VSAPEPMLSSPARAWPRGKDWMLEAKFDGYRLLVEVGIRGRIRAWSRYATSLTTRLGDLLDPFVDVAPGTVFDGELIALTQRHGQPIQDFAAVSRAVFGGDPAAAARLHYVAFDVLACAGAGDLRARPWRERTQHLTETLPRSRRVRQIDSLPATPQAHAAIVALGFEGTVLKRPTSLYRPGRQSAWRKHKARHTTTATLTAAYQDRDGQWHAVCDADGRRVTVRAGPGAARQLGEPVELVYSRVDADGSLREARIGPPVSAPTSVKRPLA
jgi:ATP-dependent DNA ligase